MTSPLLRLALFAAVILATPLLHAQRERLTPEEIDYVNEKWPGTKKTSTGIRYLVLQEGSGAQPKPGDRVGVTYVGTLLRGEKFDERLEADNPLRFRLGRGEVIDGWDQLLPAMKLSEKRLVIIPAALAYGSRGRPPSIPRDATLVFEMQLVEIKPQ
ncbi:FKBP-type peptidyl-prolyl cis-trans isomerase [Opitutus terrae]|uniref:Peptidyl-prolyl cis-trans isomerase n=1 Tax=Opitutus terrae (strain DSM 11246 / JCM 15787 / PB90-1) TaxID=452637 RepID=B1ZWV5_OPITP|nr:FKBP-type peptidyl-prolyl cis-trans isomerase [Opitutus terrae]ACB74229.1 peptidylprolyl isomerase FKBP-type [Opitutus terrae PB90-1]